MPKKKKNSPKWMTDYNWTKVEIDPEGISNKSTFKTKSMIRYIYNTIIDNIEVSVLAQANHKIDVITLTGKFSIKVLKIVTRFDPTNTFPYIIRTTESLASVKKLIQEAQINIYKMKLEDLVVVLPLTLEEVDFQLIPWAMSIAKGRSKGSNAVRSGEFDNLWLKTIKNIIHEDKDLHVFKPQEEGYKNEDWCIARKSDETILARGENKSVSEQQNITERFNMVRGKGEGSHGDIYDLFVSFPGFGVYWLDSIRGAPAHFAKAYVEFTADEIIKLSAPVGEVDILAKQSIIKNKKVMLPVDVNDPKKGLKEGQTVEDYIHAICYSPLVLIEDRLGELSETETNEE